MNPENIQGKTTRTILLEVHSPKAEAVREAIAFGTSEVDRTTPISYDQPKDLREKTHV